MDVTRSPCGASAFARGFTWPGPRVRSRCNSCHRLRGVPGDAIDIPGAPSGASRMVLGASALPLLVARVFADHHDASVPADHLALVAHALDARLNLHASSSFFWSRGTYQVSHSSRAVAVVGSLPVSVDDPASGQVVRRELHDDAITRQDADVVLPHLP